MDPMEFDPTPGKMEIVGPQVRRILAPNPSPMTFRGTNTYVLGRGEVVVIDPGPDDLAHMSALLDGLAPDEHISQILVTHSHLDHSPLARRLSQHTGAPVFAFGDSRAGMSDVMKRLADAGLAGGGEGVDHNFRPDHCLADDEVLDNPAGQITAYWTPGHFCNHMSFAFQDIVFTGDVIMGWASTMVSPPDGDLTQFMKSVSRLAQTKARLFLPGHGASIAQPNERAQWLYDHRMQREAQVILALKAGATNVPEITREIYIDTPRSLLPAAQRNVFAHLIDLEGKSSVRTTGELAINARFFLCG